MDTQTMNVNLEGLLQNKPERQPQEIGPPTLQAYATSMPMSGYSMFTIIAALQRFITVLSGPAALAEAQMLAIASQLSAQASAEMGDKLYDDNEKIKKDGGDSNQMNIDQTQYSTDQTLYGTPVNDYQTLSSILSQSVQTLNSDIGSMVGMANSLLNYNWMPTGQ